MVQNSSIDNSQTIFFLESLLVLNSEEEGLKDSCHHYGQDDQGKQVEGDEVEPGPASASDNNMSLQDMRLRILSLFSWLCLFYLHDNGPVVDHSQLKQGNSSLRQTVEIVHEVKSMEDSMWLWVVEVERLNC